MGAKKPDLATALVMSRQTIHNWLEINKHFGREGLIQSYNVGKSKSRRNQRIKNELKKLYKKLANAHTTTKKDGNLRRNSVKERLASTITEQESALASVQKEINLLPARVDVSDLENYKSIKRIDNEGKYLFDFVTASVWNARKQMVDWLRPHFDEENELVGLFYAITDRSICPTGRIRHFLYCAGSSVLYSSFN